MEKLTVCKRSNHSSENGGYRQQLLLSLQSWSLEMFAHVSQVVAPGLDVIQSFAGSFRFYQRKYLGILFLALGAISMSSHYFFNPTENFPFDPSDWYYMNAHFFMHSVRIYIAVPFFMYGVFMLQPTIVNPNFKKATAWIIVPYCLVTLSILPFASTNDQYNLMPVWSLVTIPLSIIWILLSNFKWMQYMKYHKVDGNKARRYGLLKPEMDKVPDSLWRKMAKEVMMEEEKLKQTI